MKRFALSPASREVLKDHPEYQLTIHLLTLLLSLGLFIALCVSWKNDWLSRGDLLHMVSGTSMNPSLQDGQLLYSQKREDFNRLDIVCLAAPKEAEQDSDVKEGDLLVKRIIALPGEHLEIESGGRIYIDGEYLWEPYLTEDLRQATFMESWTERIMDLQLGPNEYFVLGDNRADSLDSRAFGPVEEGSIRAAVTTSMTKLVTIHFAALILLALAIPLVFYRLLTYLLQAGAAAYLLKNNL